MGCRHDLYFMLHLPPDVAQIAIRLRARLDAHYGGCSSPMAPERLHVTLVSLGSHDLCVPHEVVQQLSRAGDALEHAPFQVSFDILQSPGPSAGSVELTGHGVGVLALSRFRRQLVEELLHGGWPDQAKRTRFRPHVTLDYRHKPIGARHIEPLAWEVTEFLLIDSHHGERHHEVLARWPLCDRQPSLFT